MSFSWDSDPQLGFGASAPYGESGAVDAGWVFNDPRFPAAVYEALKNAASLRGQIAPGSIDPRALADSGVVMSLPPRAYDGQVVRLLVDEDAGWLWTFIYRAAHAGDHKWFFAGGASMTDAVDTSESTASTTYTDLSTAGPSVTVPLPGVYAVGLGCVCSNASAGSTSFMAPRVASGTPDDDDAARHTSGAADAESTPARGLAGYFTATEPDQVISVQYRVDGGTGTFLDRYLTVTPVRVRPF